MLLAANEIAKREGSSLGRVLSDLVRQALTRQAEITTRNGVALFPQRPGRVMVTLELVNQLRDEEP